jgi:hypothetical protein
VAWLGRDVRLPYVEYQLTAEVNPPVDTPALDALQRHGVAALLDEHLELLAEIEGPDGVEIEPLDHRISVHPSGASITWVLDAPALAFAEDAARQVLSELLERTELLTDWSVRRCEVTASDEELAAALEGAMESEDGDVEIEIDLDNLDTMASLADVDEPNREERRERLLDAAGGLGAFGPESFGHDEDADESAEESEDSISIEATELVAGALMIGLDVLTEELFADVQTLETTGSPASEQEVLWVLHNLPTRYAGHYTALFAKKFLITVAVLGYRLEQPDWDGPRTIAEALAIRLLKSAAENQLELGGLLDEVPLERMYEIFDEYALAGIDVAEFFEEAEAGSVDDEDDADELVLVDWFEPLEDADEDDEYADEDAQVDETVQA